MKKIIIVFLISVIFLNASEVQLSQDEKAYVKNHPVITVISEENWPPYSYNINGIPKGYSIEFIELIAHKVGFEVEYVGGHKWTKLFDMFKNGEIDVALNMGKSDKTKEFMLYTGEYARIFAVLFAKDGTKEYSSLDDFKRKTIALEDGSRPVELLKKHYPQIKIVPTQTTLDALKLVALNKADATIVPFSVAHYLLKTYNIPVLKPLFEVKSLEQYLYFGVLKTNPILRDILEKGRKSVTTQELSDLQERYLGALHIPSFLSKANEDYLQAKKIITMCIDPDWMPFIGVEENKHTGMSADFIKIFEEKLPVKFKPLFTKDWSEALEFMKEQKCDMLPIVMQTDSRKEFLNFTSAYLDVPLVLATHKDINFIDDISSLEKRKVAVVKGFAFGEILRQKYPNLEIVEVPTLAEGLRQVEKKEIFGLAEALASINYTVQNGSFGNIKINGRFNERYKLSVATQKENRELFEIFEKTIQAIDEGKKQGILNRWSSLEYDTGLDYSLFWKILIVSAILIVLFAYRQYAISKINKRLRKEMEKQYQILLEKDRMIFQQSKLTSMGEMIENIAHQWRQPLSQVNSAVLLVSDEFYLMNVKNKLVDEKLNEIEKMTQYMSKTISDFHDFYATNKQKERFLLSQTISNVISIVASSFSHAKITINQDLDESLECNGLSNELQQVLLVILNNAKDAIKSNHIQNPEVSISLYKKENQIVLKVADNAKGIPKEYIDNIFDPYFTTKHKSQGVGIGLYIARKIVIESFGGTLNAENSKNGACFTIGLGDEDA